MLVVCTALGTASAQDSRIDQAFDLLDAEDLGPAIELAQTALKEATNIDDEMGAREVLSIASYMSDTAERAIATLADFDDRNVAAYGWRDTGRVDTLHYLMLLHQEVGDADAARLAGLRKVHLNRNDPDAQVDFPYDLMDLAVLEFAVGDPLASALMAMEVAFLVAEAEGTESPLFDAAIFLHARAHLRLDDPIRALAWANVSAQSTGQEQQNFDKDLSDYIATNSIEPDRVKNWHTEAVQLPIFDAIDFAITKQAVFWEAYENGDFEGAEKWVAHLRNAAHPSDTSPLRFYKAMSVDLPNVPVERTLPWLQELSAYPPSYLATHAELVAPIRRAEEWLVANAQHERALPLLRTARAITSLLQGPDSYTALGLIGLEADALLSSRDFVQTGRVLEQMQASTTLAQFPDLQFQAMILQGELHTALNHPKEAEAMFQSAAGLFYEGKLTRDDRWTTVLDFTAAARATLGDLPGAIALYEQALAHEATLGDAFSRRALFVRFSLAATLTLVGEHDKAIQYFEETRTIVEDNAAVDPDLKAAWHLLYAETLEAADSVEAANIEREKSQPEMTGAQNTGSRILLNKTQARLAFAANDMDAAQKFAEAAMGLMAPDDPDLAQVLAIQARVAARQGEDERALHLLRQLAREARIPGRGRAAELRDVLPLYVEVAIRLAQTSTDLDSANYLAEGFEVAQEYKSLSAGTAVAKAAVRWQSEPALAALLRRVQDSEAAVKALNTQYRTALSTGADQEVSSQNLTAGIERHEMLKKQLATEFPDFQRLFGNSAISPGDIAARLAPDEVLLLYLSSDDDNGRGTASSTIMGLTRETIMSGGTLPRSELEKLATALRCQAALTDPNCAGVAKGTRGFLTLGAGDDGPPPLPSFDLMLAHQAYQALFAPMEPILNGKSRVIIVPDATLVSVPFHTLVRSMPEASTTLRTADWQIRDTTIFVVPTIASLSALRDQPKTAAQGRFLGVGDPLIGRQSSGAIPYNCNETPALYVTLETQEAVSNLRSGTRNPSALKELSALPDTRCELQAAATYFGEDSTLLMHEDATETKIKALSNSGALAQYQTISFATHGLIAGELGSNEAGLVLTPPGEVTSDDDGLLSTGEIAQLALNADMVFLSACNTAAGNSDSDEGLSGLASAFFYAGARSILVSHWPVYSDAATHLTTDTLARRKADPALGYADALRLSMLAVLDDPLSDDRQLHPAYWAPFMVVGEGAIGG